MQQTESALDALTAIIAWVEHDLGVIIERPPEDGGTFSYHFHDRGGCYRLAGARGFATASAALIAGLAERITQLNLHAITPYLDVMEAMDTAGLVVALEQATDPAGPDRFAYTLPGGGV